MEGNSAGRRGLTLLFVAMVLLSPSCVGPMGDWWAVRSTVKNLRYSNAEVRALQSEQAERLIPEASERRRLWRELGDRVFQVACAPRGGEPYPSRPMAGGRASALTKDGYFLTALHVVDCRNFHLYHREWLEEMEVGRVYSAEETAKMVRDHVVAGELVWKDKEFDLAVIWFPFEPAEVFERRAGSFPAGTLVVAADDTGKETMQLNADGGTDKEALRTSKGNGPYFAAGTVLDLS